MIFLDDLYYKCVLLEQSCVLLPITLPTPRMSNNQSVTHKHKGVGVDLLHSVDSVGPPGVFTFGCFSPERRSIPLTGRGGDVGTLGAHGAAAAGPSQAEPGRLPLPPIHPAIQDRDSSPDCGLAQC